MRSVIKHGAMSNWYLADPHFGHDRIIDLCNRPFASIQEMDERLVANIASAVSGDDDLWIIGDFGFGETARRLWFPQLS